MLSFVVKVYHGHSAYGVFVAALPALGRGGGGSDSLGEHRFSANGSALWCHFILDE